MNIIIPICGKGERFSKNGYTQPKPLIPILGKCMINYVLDNLNISSDDKIFIIHNNNLLEQCKNVTLIKIDDTKGAAETLYHGITIILNGLTVNRKCLILDCDTFYTEDIVDIFRNTLDNMVFYTKNEDPVNVIYSYIELSVESVITDIKEKEKISDNANTGAYAFNDINTLHNYCKHVIRNNITFNNEPYTSCVISEMVKAGILFKGYELPQSRVFSLGTPKLLEEYTDNTYAFLFDLDGTLVITDEIYFDVWHTILSNYNIVLTTEIFENIIQGNNDKYVLTNLNINITQSELSILKDTLFIKSIDKLKVIGGVYGIINQIKMAGHRICIVTNCNNTVATEIVKHINISVDFIISSNDCLYGKPNIEPYKKAIERIGISNQKCFIFEDSKTGILSGKGVNPKLLIGIETIYDKNELLNYGVDYSIKDYSNLDIKTLIGTQSKQLNDVIKKSSLILNIQSILINDTKLKGGFIADVISFKIITKDGLIHPQILKYENDHCNNLSIMAKKLELYEREYYFYTNISSKICEDIKIPKFFNLIQNNNNVNCGIVLEDLNYKNYKNNLNLNLESIDVTLKIIDSMAKMHSIFWNKDLKQMFPELKGTKDTIFYPFLTDFINERYQLFKTKWFKILNTNQKDKYEEIYKNFSSIQNSFSMGNNLTFIHGDIKSPNIFYDNNNEPYFIDWQHCAIGKGVQDLIFFIIESFDIVNIKSTFQIAKYYYYKKLLENGITNYTFEEYLSDIYFALCYIPFFTSVWFGTVPQDELIDKNFPYFFITKMFYLLDNVI